MRFIGVVISVPAIISSVVSMLKMLYFRLDSGSQLSGMIARPFKALVSFIYENTQFLNVFWKISPTPNHLQISEIGNVYFIGIYFMVFVGFAFYSVGIKLSRRLDGIKEKIENQVIEESIKGNKARSREEIERVYAILSGPFILYVLNQQSHIDEQYRNIFACFRLRKSLDN